MLRTVSEVSGVKGLMISNRITIMRQETCNFVDNDRREAETQERLEDDAGRRRRGEMRRTCSGLD